MTTDVIDILSDFREEDHATVEDLLADIYDRYKRCDKSDRPILRYLLVAIDEIYEVDFETAPSVRNFLNAFIFIYMLGATRSTKFVTRHLTTKAIKDRKKKNEPWVKPFNKALMKIIKSTDLKGLAAVREALESKSLAGVKIPVGNEALRSRERQLRTGKKRT
jgi:hypothetical protein